jgi:hypothetical protein
VRAFARILIAVFVVLSQTGLGKVAVSCAELAASIKSSCPMSKAVACGCCGNENPSEPSSKCEIKASKDFGAQAVLTQGFTPIPVAVLPQAYVAVDAPVTQAYFVRPHLALPRIRTPDVDEHPLRAPPVC